MKNILKTSCLMLVAGLIPVAAHAEMQSISYADLSQITGQAISIDIGKDKSKGLSFRHGSHRRQPVEGSYPKRNTGTSATPTRLQVPALSMAVAEPRVMVSRSAGRLPQRRNTKSTFTDKTGAYGPLSHFAPSLRAVL